MTNLPANVKGMNNKIVCVFGDLMLDDFTYGIANRISPEAPVPVVDAQFTEYKLGGCANVASNLSALGGVVHLFAVTGNDEYREKILALLKDHKIHDMTIADATRPTTRKNRIIAHNQQIGRTDWEKRHDISKEIENSVMAKADATIKMSDAVIISDYAKGFVTSSLCQSIIKTAKKYGTPIIVDPKSHLGKYQGATVLTPNLKEFSEYTHFTGSKSQMFSRAQEILKKHQFSALLVTCGEDGMLLFEPKSAAKVSAIKNGHEIIDVTGAGDTAVAACALSMAAGCDYKTSMRIANYAAGVVVIKLGTSICHPEELKDIMKSDDQFRVLK
jgi:rfaE bifunctional protein kinase chain/domain